jgi:putative restriction endonuclease
MKLLVAITDSDWFNYLSELRPHEVNFWQPSGTGSFHALLPGEPLLFKLHSPNDFIVGGGFFSHYAILPASFAWSAFGQKNGATTEAEMRLRIEKYRRVEPGAASDYSIGCILLQSPFFFSREEWFPVPDWHRSIVRGNAWFLFSPTGWNPPEQCSGIQGRINTGVSAIINTIDSTSRRKSGIVSSSENLEFDMQKCSNLRKTPIP